MGGAHDESDRKRAEAAFHDRLRSAPTDSPEFERLTANRRFYAVARTSQRFMEDQLASWAPGKRILDYGCGDGQYSLLVARSGGDATGIDISPISIENCRRRAAAEGLAERAHFHVMDAEDLQLGDASFDHACVAGVLHHLDLTAAYAELARVIRPSGSVIALEALGHNPLIKLYRRLTPHLRTAWEAEHILRMQDVALARRYFKRVDVRFFHLAALFAIPFIGTPLFGPLLRALEAVDTVFLRVPWIREQAWMVGFILREPIARRA